MSSKRCIVSFVLFYLVCSQAVPVPNQPTVNKLPLQSSSIGLEVNPVSPRDPDAIVYPDEITRDSYGNPVTPFHGLLEHEVDIGHMTDVHSNKDPGPLDKRGSFNRTVTDAAGFVIPSYASGITKVETLFPNAPKFPLIVPTKTPNNVAVIEPIDISNDILPPFRDNEPKRIYPKVEVNTQATIFFPDSDFFNKAVTVVNPSTTKPTARAPEPVKVNHADIYIGSFGGSGGILGDPQPLGFAYKGQQMGGPSIPTSFHQQPGSAPDINLLPPRAPTPTPPSSSQPVSQFSRRM